MLGRPDIVQRGFCYKMSPVGGFRPLNCFEVAKLGLSCYGVGDWGLELFGPAGGFGQFLPQSGQEGRPPDFGLWGGARARCGSSYSRCECGEGLGEPLVKLVRGRRGGRGRD